MMAFPRALSNAKILRFLPGLSILCVAVGVAWLLQLPKDDYSRRTYISENALLPGGVHTYFSGSERNVFRAYRHEVNSLGVNATSNDVVEKIGGVFRGQGLKVASQKYSYSAAGETFSGENVYAVLEAPRGDATESIVLVAGWTNMDGVLNESGVALVMAMARYLKRWSLWSKDIIFLITYDSRAGPQAWVDAYHDIPSRTSSVASLPVKAGAIQGVVVVDYPSSQNFESMHVVYDGINGQLPNLDLINTAVQIAQDQMQVKVDIQEMRVDNWDKYEDRLRTMLRGMMNQGLGHSTGPHSVFIPYHIDAITLQAYGNGWHDEVTLGRTVESVIRSLNNLLEHFHQSFFFYLLLSPRKFVSIGTYLPSAMLIAGNFTIAAIGLWVNSGKKWKNTNQQQAPSSPNTTDSKSEERPLLIRSSTAVVKEDQRQLLQPLAFVIFIHFLGCVPLYVFNHLPRAYFTSSLIAFSATNLVLPPLFSYLLVTAFQPTAQHFALIKCFSLLLLGLFLSALATLNFSLSFLIGLFSSPYTFVKPFPERKWAGWLLYMGLQGIAPTTALFGVAVYWKDVVAQILAEAAFGWHVWGMWTQVVVWCVWWPAWMLAGTVAFSGTWEMEGDAVEKKKGREGFAKS